MSRFELVIFDWAGTTVDYGSFAPVKAFKEIFVEKGIEPTMDEVREPMGMLKIEHIRTMLKMPRIEGLWRKKFDRIPNEDDLNELYENYEGKLLAILTQYATPKPHTLKCIEELKEKGIKIGSTTGYNDKMMAIVVPEAAKNGYAPEFWITPDSVNGMGRPYPYMIFENMKYFKVADMSKVMKVGDTISDINEGKNAGVFTVGIIEGSSEMGITEEEYNILDANEKANIIERVRQRYINAGADAVIMNLLELKDIMK